MLMIIIMYEGGWERGR